MFLIVCSLLLRANGLRWSLARDYYWPDGSMLMKANKPEIHVATVQGILACLRPIHVHMYLHLAMHVLYVVLHLSPPSLPPFLPRSPPQWKIRRVLAYSLHELAHILGSQTTVTDLFPIFEEYCTKDVDDVKIGVLSHLAEFFEVCAH